MKNELNYEPWLYNSLADKFVAMAEVLLEVAQVHRDTGLPLDLGAIDNVCQTVVGDFFGLPRKWKIKRDSLRE